MRNIIIVCLLGWIIIASADQTAPKSWVDAQFNSLLSEIPSNLL